MASRITGSAYDGLSTQLKHAQSVLSSPYPTSIKHALLDRALGSLIRAVEEIPRDGITSQLGEALADAKRVKSMRFPTGQMHIANNKALTLLANAARKEL